MEDPPGGGSQSRLGVGFLDLKSWYGFRREAPDMPFEVPIFWGGPTGVGPLSLGVLKRSLAPSPVQPCASSPVAYTARCSVLDAPPCQFVLRIASFRRHSLRPQAVWSHAVLPLKYMYILYIHTHNYFFRFAKGFLLSILQEFVLSVNLPGSTPETVWVPHTD